MGFVDVHQWRKSDRLDGRKSLFLPRVGYRMDIAKYSSTRWQCNTRRFGPNTDDDDDDW